MATVLDKNQPDATDEEHLWFLDNVKPRKLRTMLKFAEEEIIIPDGPYQGRKFRTRYQPYSKLWFDAVDSGLWTRFSATGPSQSGKTLSCSVIPLIYHLFEYNENAIYFAPTEDIAADKWNEDIKPIIERTAYKRFLPKRGGGSRGGDVDSVRMTNGATLKFMSGGGQDKSRAAFTARVAVGTEIDAMDQPSKSSRETDKVKQIEARLRAYGDAARLYLECTASIKKGRIWVEYKSGTESKIALPCPHCLEHVTLEREDFSGWKDAETEFEAVKLGAFFCNACGEMWTDDQIREANKAGVMIHSGQTIDKKGNIQGDLPETKTLGFRWSAINNFFTRSAHIAVDEWKAERAENEENAEKEMCQFVWATPHEPAAFETTPLDSHELMRRTNKKLSRNLIPEDVEFLSAALDVGKWMIHYTVMAWRPNAVGHVVDYGILDVNSKDMTEQQAVTMALRSFRDEYMRDQWFVINGEAMLPGRIFIDAGYIPETIYNFCVESGERFLPSIGYGMSQERDLKPKKSYNRPAKITNKVRFIGEEYHVALFSDPTLVHVVEVNADHWKSWLHDRLSTPLINKDKETVKGSISLFDTQPREHTKFSKHITAEHKEQKYIPEKGMVTVWIRDKKLNHWLDTTYNACAAGHLCGVRQEPPEEQPAAQSEPDEPHTGLTGPDGQPYFILER